MKLTNISLYSNLTEVANFSFRDPTSSNPYIIENINGLDVEEIIPRFSGFSSGVSQKKQYILTLPSRTITLQIRLNPNFIEGVTYANLRDDLYRAVYSSRDGTVQLRLKNGNANVAQVSGFVTKVEVSLFDNKPIVSMTIFCKDSRLVDPSDTLVTITDQDDDGYASFSVIDDVSTLAHGFDFCILFDAPVTEFIMKDKMVEDWKFTVNPGVIDGITGFDTGDLLFFSSEQENKGLVIYRNEENIHIMDKILPGSVWPILFPGENTFVINERAKFQWVNFYHKYTYWGV